MTTLKGFVKSILQPKEGKGWVKETFVLKKFDDDKEVFCTVFLKSNQDSVVDPSLLAKDVQFEAEYNSEYKNYAVKGAITEFEHDLPEQKEPAAQGTAVATKRRTRRASTAVAPTTTAPSAAPVATSKAAEPVQTTVSAVVDPDLSEAAHLVCTNLTEARQVSENMGIKPSDDALITLADMIGRTKVALRIEAGKDRRTTEWKGRK